MTLSVNTKTYTADAYSKDTVVYNGPSNTLSVKDVIRLARTAPKPTKTFAGVSRASAKLTRTVTVVNGGVSSAADAIIEINTSLPLGIADADRTAIATDLAVWANTAAFRDTLLKNNQIAQ